MSQKCYYMIGDVGSSEQLLETIPKLVSCASLRHALPWMSSSTLPCFVKGPFKLGHLKGDHQLPRLAVRCFSSYRPVISIPDLSLTIIFFYQQLKDVRHRNQNDDLLHKPPSKGTLPAH